MPDITMTFLLTKLPYLIVQVGITLLSLVMIIALVGYSIEPFRPLYLKFFRVDVLEQDNISTLIKCILKTFLCTGITIVMSLKSTQEFLLYNYYRLFGGIM